MKDKKNFSQLVKEASDNKNFDKKEVIDETVKTIMIGIRKDYYQISSGQYSFAEIKRNVARSLKKVYKKYGLLETGQSYDI